MFNLRVVLNRLESETLLEGRETLRPVGLYPAREPVGIANAKSRPLDVTYTALRVTVGAVRGRPDPSAGLTQTGLQIRTPVAHESGKAQIRSVVTNTNPSAIAGRENVWAALAHMGLHVFAQLRCKA
jgi:hypothetical protein